MSRSYSAELSGAVNAEARKRYPKVAKQLGMNGKLASVATRFALHFETPYPYRFREDNTLLPAGGDSFGRIVKRDRLAGLREIHDTVGDTDKEHGWLFIPSESLWVDTTLTADASTVESDQYAQIFLSHMYPEIEAVHTHPDATVMELAKTDPWSYSQNCLLEAVQPSGNDLVHHCQMVARTSPDSHQVSTVVSHFGVTSFAMNGDPNKFEGFSVSSHDLLIDDASEPTAAIVQALGRLSAHVLRDDGSPAISIDFTSLP